MPRRYGPDGSRLWNGKRRRTSTRPMFTAFMAETEAVLQKQELLGGRDDAKTIAQQLAEGRAQAARENAARPAPAKGKRRPGMTDKGTSGQCPEVPGAPGGPVPYGWHRGPALPAPSFCGYALDRSALRHYPELLGCAPAAPELWDAVKWAVKPDGAVLFFAQCPYDKVLGASNLSMLRYEWVWYKSRCTGFLNARRAPLKKTENILSVLSEAPALQSAV